MSLLPGTGIRRRAIQRIWKNEIEVL